jgi:hypothetical protein
MAVAAPMPLDAPVTSATVPSSRPGLVRPLAVAGATWSKKGVSGMAELLNRVLPPSPAAVMGEPARRREG